MPYLVLEKAGTRRMAPLSKVGTRCGPSRRNTDTGLRMATLPMVTRMNLGGWVMVDDGWVGVRCQ